MFLLDKHTLELKSDSITYQNVALYVMCACRGRQKKKKLMSYVKYIIRSDTYSQPFALSLLKQPSLGS